VRIVEGSATQVHLTAAEVGDILGAPRYDNEVAMRTSLPGVATGLAWTPTGGDVLFVEVTMMPSSEERLVLTGMLGDVMRESAQAAVSYVWSNAEALGIDPKLFEGKTIHVHVPAGAGLPGHAAAGAQRRRHDRRNHPARQSASRGRNQGEGAGGPPGRYPHRDPAEAERA
jgi:ATP-dependent Lon protease